MNDPDILAPGDTNASAPGRRLRRTAPPPPIPPALLATAGHAALVETLRTQVERLETALENISIGICVFSRDQRLLLSNARYAEMYDLLPKQVVPGMLLSDILALRSVTRAVPIMSPDAYVAYTQVSGSMHAGRVAELRNGRIMLVRHQPMPDGGYVSSHEDITEQRAAERRAAYLVHHDVMTGLPNRALLRERLERAMAEAATGRPCAVLSIGLDHFRGVNDGLGYTLGDAVLCAVAERLRLAVSGDDIVARLGGDEFAILQRQPDQPHAATALAERLLRDVARPVQVDGQLVVVGASIGIALAPGDGTEIDQILRNADLALSSAKTVGRGRFELYTPQLVLTAQRRRSLEADLRRAITEDGLTLAFQPVANLATGHITGCEALVRWDRPHHGRVSPAEFIPLAEQNDMIVHLGQWVLRRACVEAAQWPAHMRVAVNVSAAQFRSPGLIEAVTTALADAGLAPSRLELEITETAMMQNWAETAAVLQQVKTLGVRISLDDFGTGYSSLSYLRRFPFDKIKIDQAFVRNLTASAESVAIIRAIVALCAALGMSTTAEGVETQEQLAILHAEHCSEVQGYLLSTPCPADEIPALLARLETADILRRPAAA